MNKTIVYALSELNDFNEKISIGVISSVDTAEKFMKFDPANRYAKEMILDDPELLNRIARESENKK